MSVPRRVLRIMVAIGLTLLGVGHVLFGLANLGFVDEFPESLDVLVEGIAAWTAAGTLFWAAAAQVRRRRWAGVVISGGLVFAAGMALSVSAGASTPEMLQVAVPVLVVGGVAYCLETRTNTRAGRRSDTTIR